MDPTGPAWCWRNGGVRTDAHEVELHVAPSLLNALPLAGAIVTGDALYCQRPICRQIVAAGGHYLLTVKGNQPRLSADIAALFQDPPVHEVTGLPIPFATAEQRDRHGDRHEVRRLMVSGALNGYLDWPGAQQVAKVERTTTRRGRTRTWTRYLITSLPEPDAYHGAVGTTAAELLARSRGHWSIENRLHYVRDVTLGEDASQIRTGAGPQALAALRNVVIALLRHAGWTNIAAGLRYNAWRPGAALQLLGLTPREN